MNPIESSLLRLALIPSLRGKPSLLVGVLILAISGCSSKQLYLSGQNWQQEECNKQPDMQARQRCLARANTSYEDYRRETGATRDAK
ncbi:hypothetical protein [Chitinimonas naiadis]